MIRKVPWQSCFLLSPRCPAPTMTALALLARAHFALQRVAFTHSLYPLPLRSPSYARRTRCALRITRTSPWLRPFSNRLFSSSNSARQVLTIVSESSTTSSTPSSTSSTSSSSTSDLNSTLRNMLSHGAVRKAFDTLSATITSDATKHEASLHVANGTSFRIMVRGLLRAQRPDLALDALWLRPSYLDLDIPLFANALRAARHLPKRKARAEAVEKVLAALERGMQEVGDARLCNREDTKAILRMSCGLAEDGNGEGASRVMDVLQSDFVKSAGIEAAVETSEYNRAIRIFGKTRLTGLVFEVLCAMEEGQVQNDSETYEFLANAVVRSVDFVTGAVNMHTLPEALPAEVAFVGRSNVGKSSLVNMLCNRKALARVSGTPGKTQQFNYFVVNERDRDKGGAYYLVDLPGLGYAKVPKEIREPWAAFMRSYVKKRSSLWLIFHLVDGRHGTMADDEVLMQMVSEAKFHGEYVIVLTKMDKMDKMKVKQSVIDKVRDALRRNGCPPKTPIVLTSANTRLGRDELWKHLRRALGATVKTMQA